MGVSNLAKSMAAAIAFMVMGLGSHADAQAYEGVTPGTDNPPPRAQRLNKRDRVVTWPGFQVLSNGSSRFFVQSTRPVSFDVRKSNKRFEVLIRRNKIHLANNRHPLETQHFETPVTRAYLKPRGRDVALVFELRDKVTPTVTQKRSDDGYNYLFVEF